MMDTATAIMITQFPIAIAILWGAWELFLIRKEFLKLMKAVLKKK